MIRRLSLMAMIMSIAATIPARSHDVWSDGSPVPDWIKSSCCGKADAHHLTPAQVHGPMSSREAYALLGQPDIPETSVTPENAPQFYVVDGYSRVIPAVQALPSQDGDYWIFYRDDGDSPSGGRIQSGVYCFFVPMAM